MLGGHNLVNLTERFPHSKGAKGLAFPVCFTSSLFVVLATRRIGVRFWVTTF